MGRWSHLYNTPQWKALRKEALRRDGYKCRRTGVMLRQGRTHPHSAVVDHIKPHRGDEALFFDLNNLQSVSKAYHDSAKQRVERNGYSPEVSKDGLPVDPNHPWNA